MAQETDWGPRGGGRGHGQEVCAGALQSARTGQADIGNGQEDGRQVIPNPGGNMPQNLVLVEAEGFESLGGWVIDEQFMDQMGSPFLLAHGLGIPVADASTEVALPSGGEYHVWVRTRDWSGTRGKVRESRTGGSKTRPGVFEVLVDGKSLRRAFGADGEEWHWEDGGTIAAGSRKVALSLHDLTGFDGRCDAILFASDARYVPPSANAELAQLRERLLGLPVPAPRAGDFDLVVVGGGFAGICAAVSAARSGLKVALIQDRPVLGGNNSSEIRVHLQGTVNHPPFPCLGKIVGEVDPEETASALPAAEYRDDKKLRVVLEEKNITLLLSTRVVGASMSGNAISQLVGQDVRSGRRQSFDAPLFADCTGDGCVGFLAGAESRMGREARSETGEPTAPTCADTLSLGSTLLWYATRKDTEQPFPETPWAMQFNDETCLDVTRGTWDWEAGMNRDQVLDAEVIRDHLLRAIYGNWAFLKNKSRHRASYAGQSLDWLGYVSGKRESRRLLGDVIVTEQDILGGRPYPDGCVVTSWPIDLHYPRSIEGSVEEPFLSRAEQRQTAPFVVPYRCLYSRNVENLLMAGRDISVTHIALGATRVMRTTGMMGEVVGKAAAIASRHSCRPRDVYERHLPELLRRLGE